MREVNLSLVSRWRLEAHDLLLRRLRPDGAEIVPQLSDSTGVTGGSDLLEQPDGRQVREIRESSPQDRFKRNTVALTSADAPTPCGPAYISRRA
jgi:hypothetical protein